MAFERVTIQVESSTGEDGPLTVRETLCQMMDAFELLDAAVHQEKNGSLIRWRIVAMSKNSPAVATAEAFCDDPSVAFESIVRQAKRQVSEGISGLARGIVAPWLEPHTETLKKLLARNLSEIGKTTFDFNDAAPRTVIGEKSARASIAAIDKYEAERSASQLDNSRSEHGTIDANVSQATTYFGRPALVVKERLSGRVIRCDLSEEAARDAGPSHSWQDTWTSKRVRIKGEIFYDKSGEICRMSASSIQDVNPQPVDLVALRKLDISAGKLPVEHLDALWGYPDE